MRILEQIYKVIAPDVCLGCGLEGAHICYWCREDLMSTVEARCYKCNALCKTSGICSACRRKTPLKGVYFRTEYTGSPKELIHRMKFNYSGSAADLIADELMNTIPYQIKSPIIVHVPTATGHVRQRGFDHADRIARRLSVLTDFPHLAALVRLGQHRQVGSKRVERLKTMKNAFRHSQAHSVEGENIILVDDVLTTGSTVESAAKTLKEAGAKSVIAVIFAQAR